MFDRPGKASRCYDEDVIEAALLSAVQIAKQDFEAALPGDRARPREAYIAALKAFTAYVCGPSCES